MSRRRAAALRAARGLKMPKQLMPHMLVLLWLVAAPAAATQQWSHIKRFNALGPFPVGKTEFDADPVVARGGAMALHQNQTARIPSELATGGYVHWSKKTAAEAGWLNVQWPVDWNRIVQAMGGVEAAEFQGWFVGSFRVYEEGMHQVDCQGVHSLDIDGSLFSGDIYGTGRVLSSMHLATGRHWISFKLRGQGTARFRCSHRAVSSSLSSWPPTAMPDLFGGELFGQGLFTLPIHSSAAGWLTELSVEVVGSSVSGLAVSVAPGWLLPWAIAPGATLALPLLMQLPPQPHLNLEKKTCVWFKLKVIGHQADRSLVSSNVRVELGCRHTKQSFLFSFRDLDGSVSLAAAIRPHRKCTDALGCTVLLSLSGVGASPLSQADSHKFKASRAKEFTYGLADSWTLAPERNGAHNWEGQGFNCVLAAIDALVAATTEHQAEFRADANRLLVAGHSRGGHGAWQVASKLPDRVMALVVCAGWTERQYYGAKFEHIEIIHITVPCMILKPSCLLSMYESTVVSD